VLVSLQRWTPFFWEQDRIGMLVPLIAAPFRNPLVNLLVQGFFYVFSYLAATFLLARYMLRGASYPLVGALSASAFLSLATAYYRFGFFLETFYGVWLALGLGGLLLLEQSPTGHVSQWHRVFAVVCIILAHWVFIGTALVLGPLVVSRYLFCRTDQQEPPPAPQAAPHLQPQRRLVWVANALSSAIGMELLLLAAGSVAGFMLMRLAPVSLKAEYAGTLPLGRWGPTCWQLLRNTWDALAPHSWPYFLAGSAGVGLLHLAVPALRRQGGPSLRAALALAAAALVWWLFLGTRKWTVVNFCVHRYTLPAVFLLQAGLIIVAVGPLAAGLGKQGLRIGRAFAVAILLLSIFAGYRLPSLSGVRTILDRELGGRTADILESRCDYVAGDYWKVWPAVFHANLVLYERKEHKTIWGVTGRSTVTQHLWPQVPLQDLRVAIPVGGEERAPEFLATFRFPPLVVVEKRPTVQVLRPQAVVLRAGQQMETRYPGVVETPESNVVVTPYPRSGDETQGQH
jgi:hypothetical protein